MKYFINILRRLRPYWPFAYYDKSKAMLAFEFAIVLSDVAKELKIEMTPDIVIRAENLLEKELGFKSPIDFACHMSVYALAILEPKE